jgi:hypothetical protein
MAAGYTISNIPYVLRPGADDLIGGTVPAVEVSLPIAADGRVDSEESVFPLSAMAKRLGRITGSKQRQTQNTEDAVTKEGGKTTKH